jgi:ribosomal subunit interface protein
MPGWAAATPGYHRRVRVLVHDRTEGVPSRLVDYAEQRLLRVGRHFDRVQEVEVEFAAESHRGSNPSCLVHITVRTDGRRHPVAHVTERAPEPRTALDLALDKVDRQVVKLKEKIKIERKRGSAAVADGDDVDDNGRAGEPERVRIKLRPQSVEDARDALDAGDHPFYVFLDESSGLVNVCYRRADGGLTVIEAVVP